MKTILVPTDFSPTADKALMIACELAVKTGCSIHLAHFYSIPMADFSNPDITIPSEILKDIQSEAVEAMNKRLASVRAENLAGEATVEMGMVTDEVVILAKKLDVDLIVMGTTGTSGVLDNLIGSNASNVMQQTDKPIILVPKDYEFEGISEIVFADSLHEDDTDVLRQLFEFAHKLGVGSVNILNVNTSSHFEPVQEELVLKLKRAFGEDKVKMNFVEADTIQEGMDIYLDMHSIDLVVMYRHKKSLLERIFSTSNTKVMALYTKVPLMVYHKD